MLQMLASSPASGASAAPTRPVPDRADDRNTGRRGAYRGGRDSRGYNNRGPQEPARPIRALILTPTRELALQIDANIKIYGRHLPLRTAVLLGGVGAGPQIPGAATRGADILISTPGRLLDLHNQGFVKLGNVEMLVLDEADRMLDMGFLPDVRRIVAETPDKRQTLLFSATMSREITALASSILNDPWRIEVKPAGSTSESIDQRVLFVEQSNKRDLLVEVLSDASVLRALVFTRTKHRASKIAELLTKQGITADAIHGNKSQSQRQRALAAFDRGRVRVLVATDVASRGIDVDGISHVINYEMPDDAESYVHRIGRTARAGAQGVALSFCDHEEVGLLRGIEHLTKCRSPCTRTTVSIPVPSPKCARAPIRPAGPRAGAVSAAAALAPRADARAAPHAGGRTRASATPAAPVAAPPLIRNKGLRNFLTPAETPEAVPGFLACPP
jgi:ATP-dependent RNA helicase RhlE